MREIKFKIWDTAENKFLTLKDYQDLGGIEVENDGTFTLSPRFRFLTSMMIMPERFIPLQYTGLKDKNGVEIYEGDIIKSLINTFEIVYKKGCFFAVGINRTQEYTLFEEFEMCNKANVNLKVIGNIYDNKGDIK